jgi:hypothetical protein
MKGARQFSPKPEAEVYRYKQLLDEHKHPFVTHTMKRPTARKVAQVSKAPCPNVQEV